MQDNFGLPERTINELLDCFEKNPNVEKVMVYGSRAKGNYRRGSDIDLAVWAKEARDVHKLRWDLEELPTPYMFDVTDYKNLTHEGMKKSIDTDGKLFYQRG